MTDDIIARAQRALDELSSYDAAPLWEIVPALIDKLKAAQHTIQRNQVALALRERELEAARAENERLRAGSIPFPPSSGCPRCDMLLPHSHGGDPNN